MCTATGCQPNCSWQIYQYQYWLRRIFQCHIDQSERRSCRTHRKNKKCLNVFKSKSLGVCWYQKWQVILFKISLDIETRVEYTCIVYGGLIRPCVGLNHEHSAQGTQLNKRCTQKILIPREKNRTFECSAVARRRRTVTDADYSWEGVLHEVKKKKPNLWQATVRSGTFNERAMFPQ
jgi:hypothetical protein